MLRADLLGVGVRRPHESTGLSIDASSPFSRAQYRVRKPPGSQLHGGRCHTSSRDTVSPKLNRRQTICGNALRVPFKPCEPESPQNNRGNNRLFASRRRENLHR
jgi:hypothetical protein